MKQNLCVSINEELLKKLKAGAKKETRSLSNYVEYLLLKLVKK